MTDSVIVENAAICAVCFDEIVSKNEHDFVTCSCGAISVDGGQQYIRRVGNVENVVEMSWSLPRSIYNDCAAAVETAVNSRCNNVGIANAVLRTLRKANVIVASGEHRVIAQNNDQLLVQMPDGQYKQFKMIEDVVE